MTDVAKQDTEALRYIGSALNLRRSIDRNRRDAEFASKHEIRYIFDTNVFIFNAFVHDSGNLNADLDNLVGTGEGRAEISRAMARLTADFLFSGRLPGQRNQTGYISLPHFEESLDKAAELERTLESEAAANVPAIEEQTRTAVASVLGLDTDIEHKLRLLGELLPKAWLTALDAKAHFRRVLRECFIDPGSLEPLDRMSGGEAAGHVGHDELQPWFNSLPRPSKQRTIDAIRDDAKTLATIVNLYRQDPESRGRDRKRLYVLVTNDGTLASAVRERRLLLAEEGIPDFIRSPRDYLPLLNLDAMSKAMDRVRPTPRMRAEFLRVFETLSSAIEWISVVSRDQTAINLLDRDDGPLWHLQTAWTAISEFVTILNARHLLGDDSVFSDLRDFITADAEQAATRLVASSVRAVRDAHLAIALNSALLDLGRANSRSKFGGPRRIHLQVVGDVLGKLVPRESDLNAFLDGAVALGELPAELAEGIVKDPGRAEIQLLAACLFMAADRWAPAVQAAGRAVEKLEAAGGPDLNDARYLLAHCLRFSMRSRHELDRAVALLGQNSRAYVERGAGRLNWSRRLRDEMERGSLLVTAAVLQELSRTPTGERHLGFKGGVKLFDIAASDMLARGVRSLEEALETLVESEGLDVVRESDPWSKGRQFLHGLRMLATTNLTEAYIFEQIAPGLQGKSPPAPERLDQLLDALRDEIEFSESVGETLRPTQYIYYWRARALTAQTPMERRSALDELDGLLEPALKRHELPLIDALEFNYITDKLAEERGK